MAKLLIASICIFVALLSLVKAELTLKNETDVCADRSGLKRDDITAAHLSENGCRLDCIVFGSHRQYNLHEGKECHAPGDWKCLRGQCLSESERNSKSSVKLHDVTIKLKRAFVPDEDKTPINGESDVFVIVKVSDAAGQYEDGAVIGNTPTIQDTNRPVWDNFVLRPNSLPLDAKVKFQVFDSDKPFKPDFLGRYESTIRDLVEKSKYHQKYLYLTTADGIESSRYYIEAEVNATEVVNF